MSDYMIESMAWGEVKHTDPIDHPVELKKARCNLCLQEEFRRCAKEQPDWFTPKTKVARADKREQVRDWLEKNVKEQTCMVFEYQTSYGYYGDETEDVEVAICAGHLAGYLDLIYNQATKTFPKVQSKIMEAAMAASKKTPALPSYMAKSYPKDTFFDPNQTHCMPGKHLGMGGGYTEICEVCGKNVYD